ncbi:MAG: YsnF/AvaK domain-containing protein [Candidatus Dormibacteraeota bacterium]|uniref:YsnF/AvaK domain-containing protein n=1 Tax=Candidatus Dormiibacter inghamiae TaxID=3127013 RepID=A0A934NCW2_9BACT|nr:YsnF/AvaK domain-containing protein [Candidatus Dormibacteraeota bacterium]MBJ7604937.1 YsnF/AvaK domain-containing protein [Candidatus Dormibacteraeota bacterium]
MAVDEPESVAGKPPAEEKQSIELREEELQARKQRVETGEVKLRKEVVTERREIEVPVAREEVFVERQRLAEPAPAPDAQIEEGEFRVTLAAEEVSVEKRTVVREEVVLGKRQITDLEHVEGEVRREAPRIERHGVDASAVDESGSRHGT